MNTVTLYRPVGQPELDLIIASGMTKFPPRLAWQPIFYPVCNEAYARQIARDWNTKDPENGAVGYVTRFQVDQAYLACYQRQTVGSRIAEEYWIPAEKLDEFNRHIMGPIEVIAEYRDNLTIP